MWGRAEQQASAGAGVLFARLGAPDGHRAESIAALQRLIARLRAGEWSDDLADLVTRALAADGTQRQLSQEEPPASLSPALASPGRSPNRALTHA
jgi:hypothetical protein